VAHAAAAHAHAAASGLTSRGSEILVAPPSAVAVTVKYGAVGIMQMASKHSGQCSYGSPIKR
jgi:hypothetical protein